MPNVRAVVKRIVPPSLHDFVRQMERGAADWHTKRSLAHIRTVAMGSKPGAVLPLGSYRLRVNDGPNFYMQYKDIFVHRSYHFQALRQDPVILDCGSNIGMSILYYKHMYPEAKVTGFEPDPVVWPYLRENIERNNLTRVELVQAAISGTEGRLAFGSDGKYASCLLPDQSAEVPEGWTKQMVPCVRLRDSLTRAIDFMKLNIEGAEWEALSDSEDRLRQVREMVIEYHHLPNLPRTLHDILALLHRQGFEYLVNDFDSETNGGVAPPFHLTPATCYFLLVYAKRID